MDNPIRLHWLDPRDPQQPFPPAHLAMRDPNGLLAIGGDLSPPRLLRAYAQGIFPWYNPDEPILWWSPDPRAVLEPGQMHVSRSLSRALRRADYAVSFDRDFAQVLKACGGQRAKSRGTWLGEEMQEAYLRLFRLGHAHSVEVWRRQRLIGGLYGVCVGRMFYGESMFTRETDASKIALYWLGQQLQAWSFELIDCQIASPHLLSLGARSLDRAAFLARACVAAQQGGRPGPWRFGIAVPDDAAHRP
jgi:leucyl/phenylalanyl-tRNA---protein transferase